MSPPHDSHGSEERRLRPDALGTEGLADSVLYYGLGQTALLTGPMLWFVFQTPTQRVDLATGGALGLCSLVLAVGLRRQGLLAVGRPWPALGDVPLGLGGYRYYLGRAVFLSTAVGGAAFGAAAVGSLTPATLPVAATGVGVPLGCVLAYPYAHGLTRRDRVARAVPYAVVLVAAFHFGRPLTPGVGFNGAPVWYAALLAVGAADLLW